MKNTFKLMAAAAIVVMAASCTKDFEEINTNPNKFTVGSIKAYNTFESLLYGTGTSLQGYAYNYTNEIAGMTAFTGGATSQIHRYYLTDGNWQTIWNSSARYGYDATHMMELAQNDDDQFLEALGHIFRAYHLCNLASIFGDIPYTEAYQGRTTGNKTPVFDSQVDVFKGLISELDEATAILATGVKPAKTGLDGMYGDDDAKWIKFANSLRMRILNRLSGIDDSYWSEIQKMVSDPENYPVFESNDDSADVPYSGSDPYQAYFQLGDVTTAVFNSHRLTEVMIKMMYDSATDYADPRLPIWGTQRDGVWKGTVAGCSEVEVKTADESATALNANTLNRNDVPSALMDYSEVLFIYAEGVAKGKLSMKGTAKEYYEAAVRASMEKWANYGAFNDPETPITDADITAYLASPIGSYDIASTTLYSSAVEMILSQKWLSLFWCGWEPYCEWRRNEYPIITIGSGTNRNDYEYPTRMGYPASVTSSNNANMTEALARMGGENDMHTALVWSYKALNGGSRPEHIYSNYQTQE